MKDFIMKHPIITYCIINDILVTVQNIVLEEKRKRIVPEIIDVCDEAAVKIKKEVIDKTKETIGFKFVKEEA